MVRLAKKLNEYYTAFWRNWSTVTMYHNHIRDYYIVRKKDNDNILEDILTNEVTDLVLDNRSSIITINW